LSLSKLGLHGHRGLAPDSLVRRGRHHATARDRES
jgi:hypothetical protein